jgi:hypothetical protein
MLSPTHIDLYRHQATLTVLYSNPLQQIDVCHSTLVKIVDSDRDLRPWLYNVLRDFGAGRWTPSAGEFRYNPLFGPESWGKSKEVLNTDYSCGIGVVAIHNDMGPDSDLFPCYNPLFLSGAMFAHHKLKPLVFIGTFLLADDGIRRMTGGIRMSPALACRLLRELPAIMHTMNSLETR